MQRLVRGAVLAGVACGLVSRSLSGASERETPIVVAIAASVSDVTVPHATVPLTDLLMSQLASDARWRLVEREQLQSLEDELALSAGGWTDAANAVRLGRMVKADIIVVCRLQAVGDAGGEAVVEAVDAWQAEPLASGRAELSARPNAVWLRAVPREAVDAIAASIAQVLDQAERKLIQVRGTPAVAALFAGAPPPSVVGGMNLEELFREELKAAAERQHCRIPALGVNEAVQGEGRLQSAGLMDSSSEAWAQVAHLFVWGDWTFAEAADATSPWIWRLHIWNGQGEPNVIAFGPADGDARSVARKAANAVVARAHGATRPTADVRQKVADILMQRVRDWASSDEQKTLVDVAAYFVPGARRIQELRLRMRQSWGPNETEPVGVDAAYLRLVRAFWRLPDGSYDLGLVERGVNPRVGGRAALEFLTEVGLTVRGARIEDFEPFKRTVRAWMEAFGDSNDRDAARAAFEAWWPIARLLLADPTRDGLPGLPVVLEHPFDRLFSPFFGDAIKERGEALREAPLKSGVPQPGGRSVKVVYSALPTTHDWSDDVGSAVARMPPQPLSSPPKRMPAMSPHSDSWLRNQLRQAVQGGMGPDRIRLLIENGADPLASEGSTDCALIAAVRAQQWDDVGAMLSSSLDPHRMLPDSEGGDPIPSGPLVLCCALRMKRSDLALELLKAGVQPGIRPTLVGGSPLMMALENENDEVIDYLLRLGVRPAKDDRPVHWAVRHKDLGRLRQLVKRVEMPTDASGWTQGLGIDDRDQYGLTPLWVAVLAGWADGVRELIAAGARVDVTDRRGRRLAEEASPYPEIALLINGRPGAANSQMAGAAAVAAVVRNDRGLDTWPIDAAVLQYHDSKNWTVLHHACGLKRLTFAKRLVAAGADLNATTVGGQTPLKFAAQMGDADLVAMMLQHGAEPNQAGGGAPPIAGAVINGDPEILRLLLKAGADPRVSFEDDGTCAVLLAAQNPNGVTILKILKEAGASLCSVDALGFGALEHAIHSDEPDVIQYLLDSGVSWRRLAPGEPHHPLLEAVRNEKIHSLRKLLDLGIWDDRALPLARNAAIRDILEDYAKTRASNVVDDAELWPAICGDMVNGVQRAKEHIDRGGNVNFAHREWTPLILAAREKNVPVIRYLVQRGANPVLRPTVNTTARALDEFIRSGPRNGQTKAQFDEECAGMVRLLVPGTVESGYEFVLGGAVIDEMRQTVRALLAAGVPLPKTGWGTDFPEKVRRLQESN